jgi:AbrB family looped-hinge helix DNA binding protein
MALVRMLRGGQVTLPAEARRALKLREGDYLDLEVDGGALTLRPMQLVDRADADRELDEILRRVQYIGAEPEPSEEMVLDMVATEIRRSRRKNAKSRTR